MFGEMCPLPILVCFFLLFFFVYSFVLWPCFLTVDTMLNSIKTTPPTPGWVNLWIGENGVERGLCLTETLSSL